MTQKPINYYLRQLGSKIEDPPKKGSIDYYLEQIKKSTRKEG